MKAVGIKILKNNLSRYIKMVKEGETLLVLDRDEVVAEIKQPSRSQNQTLPKWQEFFNRLEQEGGLIKAKRQESRSGEWLATMKPFPASIKDNILEESREDRF